MKYYKIKVGIEEYSINEEDIPRIATAMQNNDIVKLESGLFRGQAILAVCRDTERENLEATIIPPTPEQIQEKNNQLQIEKQKAECKLCKNGWLEVFDGKEIKMKRCECNFLLAIKSA